MTIQLYNNSSDPRVLNKSLTAVGSAITCKLTDECTVEDPSFKMTLSSDYLTANYLKVSEWNKYYFITDRNIINGHEIIVNCHIDVLRTYRDAILNSEVICERSSSTENPYLPDNACADRGTIQQVFRKMSTTPFSKETNCYVLHIAGKS